jgi:hypothetical protein
MLWNYVRGAELYRSQTVYVKVSVRPLFASGPQFHLLVPGFLSIRHIHMDMEYGIHMDTYGHTEIILASGHNTTSQSSLLSFYRLQSSQQLRCL